MKQDLATFFEARLDEEAELDDAAVAQALRSAGFQVTDTSATAPASRHTGPPVIRYAPGGEYGPTRRSRARRRQGDRICFLRRPVGPSAVGPERGGDPWEQFVGQG